MAVVLASVLALLALVASASALRGEPVLVSQAGGAGADDSSSSASISADGRYVAFQSGADNLSADDNNDFTNVFRQDLVGPPPVCSNVARAVARDFATLLPLTCADEDGDPLTRSIASGPAHGSLGPVDQATGTVTYTPDPGYTGPDSFGFQAADASGDSNTATASLTVSEPPPAGGGGGGGGAGDAPLAFGAKTLVTLKLAAGRIPAKGPLKVRVANANGFAVTGKLSGQTAKRVSVAGKRRIKLKATSFSVGAQANKVVKLKLPKTLRRLLKRTGKLKLRLTAKVKDPAGNTRSVKKQVTPRLKKQRRR